MDRKSKMESVEGIIATMKHNHAHQIVEKKLGIPPDYQYKALKSKNFLQSNWHANKLELLKKIIPFKKNIRILDLGCGSGNVELTYAKKVKEIVAVDYNDEAIQFLKKKLAAKKITNVKLFVKDIRKINQLKKIGKFDVILIIDVIEHIKIQEAEKVVSVLSNFLKEDGILCVITPNYKSPWTILEQGLDMLHVIPHFDGEQHLAKFYKSNIAEIGKKAGLVVTKFYTFNLFSFVLPGRTISKKLLQIERYIPLPVGNLLCCVFSKNFISKESLKKWQKEYANDQEKLYKNGFVKTLFDLGHKYIASQLYATRGVILDIGSGMGYHLNFEKLYEDRQYICLDSDQNMLHKINKKFVRKIHSSCEKIPLQNSSVDGVIASHILEHVPNLSACVKEVKRVLKKKGKFVVVLPCDPGLAWNTMTKFSPSRKRLKKVGLDYDEVMKHEHVNSFTFCLRELEKTFAITDIRFFPLGIKNYNLNLICGITCEK